MARDTAAYREWLAQLPASQTAASAVACRTMTCQSDVDQSQYGSAAVEPVHGSVIDTAEVTDDDMAEATHDMVEATHDMAEVTDCDMTGASDIDDEATVSECRL